ncbi:UBA-like protein [Artemisia annua]|uniref:UBA-like protein n=1 Tax=Artemisia annua TaxID=35608 RepID=A0A2U1L122_ARTAN|nr:UBA-like protein [Artemisia annua]
MERRPDQESINTFMSITGSSEPDAILKLTEHGGNLSEAVNSHFAGDTNIHDTNVAAPHEDFMDIDEPSEVATHQPPFSPLLPARDLDPFSLLEPSGLGLTSAGPFVSHGTNSESLHPESVPRIIDVTDTLPENIPESVPRFDDDFPSIPEGVSGVNSHVTPSAPSISDIPDDGIEEQMIQAAIEASKREAEISLPVDVVPQNRQSQLEDPELEHAVSLSMKSVEQENVFRGLDSEAGPSETGAPKLAEVEEVGTLASSNGRLDIVSSSTHDESEDADEQPLVRHRTRRVSSSSTETASVPTQQHNVNNPLDNENEFPSEWGGISSEEHDEAVMLEAAMFGGIPGGGAEYREPYATRSRTQNSMNRIGGPYQRPAPRPPSPSLTAQRLIREQQDDEFLAALQADREKELLEQTAREAAMEEERRKEEEAQRKLEEEQEVERQLAAKEASLPKEPASDDENGVTLLVRMPDGSRRGRRFLRTDKLQYLFDFIDVGRVVKPSTYRLVRPYPRRAFSDGESDLTLNELGLTSKQEALFLESI